MPKRETPERRKRETSPDRGEIGSGDVCDGQYDGEIEATRT